uniref:WD repeat domain 73 n=1 Tax=Leptobrachium leishanense TaxID=445787 RepID=A0A8C5P899_9ANUR
VKESVYKELHDFELQDATRVLEWTGDKRVCVAGFEPTKTNEILQLLLPAKLHTRENQCLERDLKVEHGGFSEHPVYSLKHVPHSSLLVTSGPAASPVQVWEIGNDEKDVIKPLRAIPSRTGKETYTKIATTSMPSPRVAHGSKADSVNITEIESDKVLYSLDVTRSDPVGNLYFVDCNTFFVCCTSGLLYVADVRQPHPALEGKKDATPAIASLSSEGHIVITDTRKLGSPLKSARSRASTPASSELFMCVSWAPVLDDTIAISGLDSTVQIYNTSSWDATMRERDPLFTHKGHSVVADGEDESVPMVTVHSWHPWNERTLLSAATDGSLHAWDWSDKLIERDS